MKKLARKGNMNQRIDVVLRKFRSRLNSYPPGMCPLVLYRSDDFFLISSFAHPSFLPHG